MENKQIEQKLTACCDIFKDEEKVVLRMEMPGINKNSLSVRIDGNILFIEGKREIPVQEGEYRIKEIRQGDYYHEFTLDDTISRDNVDAKMEYGVLTLTLRLKESEKPRSITVKAS